MNLPSLDAMQTRHAVALALLWLTTLLPARDASAQSVEGLYGWYEAGVAVAEETTLVNYPGVVPAGNAVEFDPGFHFGIAIGQKLTRFLKVEVESGFNYNSLSSIAGATSSSANFYRVPVMGNVVLEWPNRTGIVPVIGAGAGAQWAVFEAQNVTLGGFTLSGTEETWVFSYGGYAGVRYEFREDMSLGLFYHYTVADSPSWSIQGAPANFKLDDIKTHSFSVTFGWIF